VTEYQKDAEDQIGWDISRGNKGLYLVGLIGEKVKMMDGPHDRVDGVVEALELYKRLGFAGKYDRFAMVEISDVPEPSEPVKLNDESIAICNEMLDQYAPNRGVRGG
jgi:hypothetical protein